MTGTILPGTGPRPAAIETRLVALRLSVPGGASARARADEGERLLANIVAHGLALHAPMLGAALTHALVALDDLEGARAAVAIAQDAARFMGDLPGELMAWTASARIEQAQGMDVEVPDELVACAVAAGLWPGLLQLALVRCQHAAASTAAKRILPNLDLADANALSLMPWAVAADA